MALPEKSRLRKKSSHASFLEAMLFRTQSVAERSNFQSALALKLQAIVTLMGSNPHKWEPQPYSTSAFLSLSRAVGTGGWGAMASPDFCLSGKADYVCQITCPFRIFRNSYSLALAATAATLCYRLVLFIEMFVFSNENDVTISHSAPKFNLLTW